MPSERAKINDSITRSFRDVADDDYIAARALYRIRLDQQFLWSALQAVEKYLKAILLYPKVAIKDVGHDISRALEKVRSIPDLKLQISGIVENFVRQLGAYGVDRYFQQPINTEGVDLPELDRAVWELRKYCRAVRADEGAKAPINGRLEEVLSQHSRARNDLIWKNLYFGRFKKIKFSRRVKWANPSNFIYPEIFPQLDKLIPFSKQVRKYLLDQHKKGAAKKRAKALTRIQYTRPSETDTAPANV